MTTKANYRSGADVLDGWRDDVLSGKPPTCYPIGEEELSRLEIGPGLVTLLGGAPGSGKTAFTMQAVVNALRLTPTLRAVVGNIEMPPGVLLDRQLARLSGVDLATIRYRRLTAEHSERIDAGLTTLAEVCDRLAFVRPPFDLANIAAVADEFDAGLIVLDYITIAPGCRDEDAARSVLSKLERRAELVRSEIISPAEDANADHQATPLTDHFAAFHEHRTAKGLNAVRIANTKSRLERLADGCGFGRLADCSADALTQWLSLGFDLASRWP